MIEEVIDTDWCRIKNISRLRNLSFEKDDNLCVIRVYSVKGKTWPRLVMTIRLFEKQVCFLIAYKRDKNGWWESTKYVPRKLTYDIVEMWQEAQFRIASQKESA